VYGYGNTFKTKIKGCGVVYLIFSSLVRACGTFRLRSLLQFQNEFKKVNAVYTNWDLMKNYKKPLLRYLTTNY
jgi:hypothetical protein